MPSCWLLVGALFVGTPSPAPSNAAGASTVASGMVVGRVVDARTKVAIAGATVVLTTPTGTTQTAITNESGLYRFTGLPAGGYQVSTSLAEARVTRIFALPDGERARANLVIDPSATTTRTIRVRAATDRPRTSVPSPECVFVTRWEDPTARYERALRFEAIREAFSR